MDQFLFFLVAFLAVASAVYFVFAKILYMLFCH